MNDVPDLLAALQQRERDLELDAIAVRSRMAEVREMIALAKNPRRRRKPSAELSVVPPAEEPPVGAELPLEGETQHDQR